jgi:hypothetical protein
VTSESYLKIFKNKLKNLSIKHTSKIMLYESISYGNNKNILPSSVVVVVISLVVVGTSDVSVVGEGSVWNERIFIGQKTDLRSIFENVTVILTK